jgi:hypothetical protein
MQMEVGSLQTAGSIDDDLVYVRSLRSDSNLFQL